VTENSGGTLADCNDVEKELSILSLTFQIATNEQGMEASKERQGAWSVLLNVCCKDQVWQTIGGQ